MNWLFPLYLAGAVAVVAPILLHLRRRPPQERVEFSSLLFLEAQTPMPVSKRRLEHWLLLLLRCLALVLLALMFARPFVQHQTAAATSPNRATLILLDRSASMRREDLWKRAVAQALRAIQEMKFTDRVALAVYDAQLRSVWSFDEDRTAPGKRLASIEDALVQLQPGWGGTHLDRALAASVPLFDASTATLKKRILLISDLQEGTHLDELRTVAWPAEVALQLQRVDPAVVDNLSLALAAAEKEANAGATASASAAAVRVRLANTRDSALQHFTLNWERGPVSRAITAQLPAGASRILTVPPNETGSAQLLLTGDQHEFDNRVFVAPAQARVARLHFLGDASTRDQPASPLYYLARALQPTETLAPELTAGKELPQSKVEMIFSSGPAANSGLAEKLRDFLNQGGFLVHVLQSSEDAALLQTLTGAKDVKVTLPDDGGEYRMLGEVKVDHPLLRPFADPRLKDFTKLRFWRHRSLQMDKLGKDSAGFELLASFDDGSPAMVTARVGRGTLVVLASGWHPADSQLALSTKFVPLLFGWLSAAGFRHDPSAALFVGDSLPLDLAVEHTVTSPSMKKVTVPVGRTITADEVGLYQVQSGERTQVLAVNLPPEEMRVLPLEPQRLATYGVQLSMPSGGAAELMDSQRFSSSEVEQRQQGWWWILMGLLAVLLLETWLAGRARQTVLQTT